MMNLYRSSETKVEEVQKMNASVKILGALFLTMVLISPAVLGETWPPSSYKAGDEKNKLGGHTFKEEY